MSGFESDIWGHAVIKALHTKPENPGCPFLITTVNLTNDPASQSYRFLVTKVGRITPQTKPSLTIADLLKPEPFSPFSTQSYVRWGFPCGTSGKESTCQCRRCKRHGFNPWVGKIPWRKKWQPTPVFLPAESHERSPAGYSPWGHKESDTTQWLTHTWPLRREQSLLFNSLRNIGSLQIGQRRKSFHKLSEVSQFLGEKKTASRREFC